MFLLARASPLRQLQMNLIVGRESARFVWPENAGPIQEGAFDFLPPTPPPARKVEKRKFFNKNDIMLFKECHGLSRPEKTMDKKQCGRLSLGDIYGIFP